MASGTIKAVVPKSDIVNDLTTNDSTKVLSAAQGYALNSKIANAVSTYTLSSGTTATYTNIKLGALFFVARADYMYSGMIDPTGDITGLVTRNFGNNISVSYTNGTLTISQSIGVAVRVTIINPTVV